MKRDLIHLPQLDSSFLSCDKDSETILRRLFIESQPYSNELRRMLVLNTKDCLTNNSDAARAAIEQANLKWLIDNGYIRLQPKLKFGEHEEVKSYILISYDNFVTNATNPQFRDCTVSFDVICHTDYWDVGNYAQRPLKIVGYIDGLLNNTKLSGIGTFQFLGCNELILDENLAGYTLMFSAIHGTDDRIPASEEKWASLNDE